MDNQKINLRRLQASDVTLEYVNWMNDPEINRYLESRYDDHSLTSIKTFVEAMSHEKGNFLFGIFCNKTSLHIGNIKLGPIDYRYLRAEIGLIVGNRNFWGKGIATEAILIICKFAAEELKLRKVEAGCYSSNQGSKKAFVKAGFEVEGLLKEHFYCNGKPEDSIRLGKVLVSNIQQ